MVRDRTSVSRDSLRAVRLSRPARALVPSYLDFIDEMRTAGETIWPTRVPRDGDDGDAFVARLLDKETTPEAGFVAESVFWGVVDGNGDAEGDAEADAVVVGVITLRHHLTERLARFGGHVGYEVRPSVRRRGVATSLLRLLLATERARALGRVLVTCAPTNTGSRKAIEANGGVLDVIAFVDEVQRETCRYWIDVDGG